MIGKSYDGTLANGVAATGVKGLKTIVPISAISSWYDYDRSQGLPFSYNYPSGLSRLVEQARTRQVNCSAINAQHGPAGRRRDRRLHQVLVEAGLPRGPAAVGLEGAPRASSSRTACRTPTSRPSTSAAGTTCSRRTTSSTKVWLSRLGHVDPFDYRREPWVDTLHRWFDSQLMGIKNGILKEPRVDVETSPGHWVTSNTWPVSDNNQKLTFHADGSLTTGAPEGHRQVRQQPEPERGAGRRQGQQPQPTALRHGFAQEATSGSAASRRSS